MKADLIIANPPYGSIGANITKQVMSKVEYKEFINLEPGNDYFINDNYKHIDSTVAPKVLEIGAFTDANQATTIAKIIKDENDLTATGARLLLSVRNDKADVYKALSELFLNTESNGSLTFTRKSLEYADEWFIFNSGGFDIHNGYLAVADKGAWTNSTNYNIFMQKAETTSGSPAAKVRGCRQFKKLVYSELGLKMLKLWFASSPEGWGFGGKLGAGMFADIDYSDCDTWRDVFDRLNVSKANQNILIEAANKFALNDKEKEISEIVRETL